MINGGNGIPRIWFLPNGMNGWTPVVTNAELKAASENIRKSEGMAFEAMVPSLTAPTDTQIRQIVLDASKKRTRFLRKKILAISVLGIMAAIVGIMLSPKLLFVSIGVSVLILAIFLVKFLQYNRLAYRLKVDETLGYSMNYRQFLQHLAVAIEYRATNEEPNPVVALKSEQGYRLMLKEHDVSKKMLMHVATLVAKHLDEADCSGVAASVYKDLVKFAPTVAKEPR